jgi:hypothetical protein
MCKLNFVAIGILVVLPIIGNTAVNSESDSSFKMKLMERPGLDSVIRRCLIEIDSNNISSYMQEMVNFKTRFMLADNRKEIVQ